MSVTPQKRFNTVVENSLPGTPTKEYAWTNPGNANTDSDATYAENEELDVGGSIRYGYWLEYTGPLLSDNIPSGSTITNINIRVRAEADEPEISDVLMTRVQIEPGDTTIQSGVAESIEWIEFDGDLTYWNLTQSEALDFVNDTGGVFKFYNTYLNAGGAAEAKIRIYNAECQVTFDPPARYRFHVT